MDYSLVSLLRYPKKIESIQNITSRIWKLTNPRQKLAQSLGLIIPRGQSVRVTDWENAVQRLGKPRIRSERNFVYEIPRSRKVGIKLGFCGVVLSASGNLCKMKCFASRRRIYLVFGGKCESREHHGDLKIFCHIIKK